MSTLEFDAMMNKMDLHDRMFKLARTWNATDELAEIFAASQVAKGQFKWDGVVLTYNGKNAVDDLETKKHFTEGALSPIFPKAATDKDAPKIPPELLESARAGNYTSKGALVRLLGSLEAAEAALADKSNITVVDDKTTPVKLAAPKNGNNPWNPDTIDGVGRPAWSPAARRRQADVVRNLGPAKAGEIAKAANPPAFLGSTKPGAQNLTSFRRSA
jgi:hypothetical protein